MAWAIQPTVRPSRNIDRAESFGNYLPIEEDTDSAKCFDCSTPRHRAGYESINAIENLRRRRHTRDLQPSPKLPVAKRGNRR